MTDTPRIGGDCDTGYLGAALARAGLPPGSGELSSEPLTGGRTGARVDALRWGEARYVLKRQPRQTWRGPALGTRDRGEGPLWLDGTTRALPSPLRCPVVDAALHEERDEWWLLMRDVGAGIRPRGTFSIDDTRRLLDGLAPMWVRHQDDESLRGRVPTAERLASGFARVALAQAEGNATGVEPWVREGVEELGVLRDLLPGFLERLTPALADAYVQLLRDSPEWGKRLAEGPQTLIHGDLRRANIALTDDGLDLIDWEFAGYGPAAADIQWHCLLHYWVYPPEGGHALDATRAGHAADLERLGHGIREHHREGMERTLGRPVDRAALDRAWELGWVKAMAQLGFCFGDIPADAPDERARAERLARGAVELALRYLAR